MAIFASYPAFRWVFFQYAIEKGVNVFMEKPVTVDGPTTRKMLALAEQSVKKNLKVAVGLMIRHCRGRQQLVERIRSNEIGEILTLRAYRMSGPISTFAVRSEAGRHQRAALPDPAVGQFPVGQRRLLQRFQHPSDR